jgi:hypothetical protein
VRDLLFDCGDSVAGVSTDESHHPPTPDELDELRRLARGMSRRVPRQSGEMGGPAEGTDDRGDSRDKSRSGWSGGRAPGVPTLKQLARLVIHRFGPSDRQIGCPVVTLCTVLYCVV